MSDSEMADAENEEAAIVEAPPAPADEEISDTEEGGDALAPEHYPAPLKLETAVKAPSDALPWVEKVSSPQDEH